jgi:hypothetical protein
LFAFWKMSGVPVFGVLTVCPDARSLFTVERGFWSVSDQGPGYSGSRPPELPELPEWDWDVCS